MVEDAPVRKCIPRRRRKVAGRQADDRGLNTGQRQKRRAGDVSRRDAKA
jgi:hypothetical protein